MQRRLLWRNQKNLYQKKCEHSGKDTFSFYPPDSPYKIYDHDFWWSDEWDPMDYGKNYDFGRSFFEQLKELFFQVPIPSRSIQKLVNSDYSADAGFLKNCYLIFNSGYSEDCAYGTAINETKDSYSNSGLEKCELCYEGFILANCYQASFCSNCDDCQNVSFCIDCVNCQDCFGCVNLRNKRYHIFNKQYSRQEYEKKLEEFGLGSHKNVERMREKMSEFKNSFPVRFMHGRKNVDVSGEYIYNSKKVKDCYGIRNCENMRYCFEIGYVTCRDCHDYSTWGEKAQLVYDSCSCGDGIYQIKFSYNCWPNCRNLEYCMECHSSSDLFGCIGLRHKQYCIFNKQYTRKEYEELVPKIKKHMNEMPFVDNQGIEYKYGEYFPPEFSPAAYNETIAQLFFPLSKESAIAKKYFWHDKSQSGYQSTITANDLLDHIDDIDESVLGEVIECTRKPEGKCKGSGVYAIIPSELEFHRKRKIPLPRICPDCRYHLRIKQRNPLKLHERQCMCGGEKDTTGKYQNHAEHSHGKERCKNTFQTTYPPGREEIVYCKECYQRETE